MRVGEVRRRHGTMTEGAARQVRGLGIFSGPFLAVFRCGGGKKKGRKAFAVVYSGGAET